jgi:hypothetical protein
MELEKVVQSELDTIVSEGVVQKIIRKQLESTITSVISDSLREYSDFGKELKDAVKNAMKIDFKELSMVEYNHIVLGVIKEQLDKTLYENAVTPIRTAITQYIGVLDKEEWKLSEIISEFTTKGLDESDEGFNITLIVEESSHGYVHVFFDEKGDKRKYDCEYQLDITKEGRVYSFKAGKYNPLTEKVDLTKRPIHGSFDTFMFKLYASGIKVIVDEDYCKTESYED